MAEILFENLLWHIKATGRELREHYGKAANAITRIDAIEKCVKEKCFDKQKIIELQAKYKSGLDYVGLDLLKELKLTNHQTTYTAEELTKAIDDVCKYEWENCGGALKERLGLDT